MSLRFTWDPRKAAYNFARHRLSFREAVTAFEDPLSLTVPDPDHSEGERRFVLVGMTRWGRTVVVVHTEQADNVRIVSARLASRAERKAYEER